MRLADAVALYVDGRAARGEVNANTAGQMAWRLSTLEAAVGPDRPVADLDRAAINVWLAHVGWQRPASRRGYLSTVKVFCRWAVLEGLLAADPTVAVARVREPCRVPRNLSAVAVSRLRLVLPDRRAEVIVGLMFTMGLRCIEVARLAVDYYDPVSTTMVISGKSSDERRLPVPPDMVALLARWAPGRPPAGPMVGVSAQRISVLVSAWMADAGIKASAYDGVSAHALRHTFASNTLDRCGNVRTVQAALGHQSLATTERYLRWTTLDELRAAMSA